MIQLAGVSYQVGNVQLLHEVTFTVTSGQMVAIVGANGAGKTTLLRLISGELSPTTGRIWFQGTDLSAIRPEALARKRSVLLQPSTLGFSFTVSEVVRLGRTPYRHRRSPDEAVAAQAMAAARVEHLAERNYPTLSGGEQKRVQFARTLAQLWESPGQNHDKLLLLDEPAASLDLVHRQMVLSVARQCARSGAGVVVVLHDLNLAAQYADAILVLCRGRQCAFGTPDQVLTREVIRETFDVDVLIGPHPCAPCPLVLTVPATSVPTQPKLSVNHDT